MDRRAVGLAIVTVCGILGWLLLASIPVTQSDYVHWFRPVTLNWVKGSIRLYAETPGFRNPPWTVLLLLPSVLLPTQLGAGLIRLLTVCSVMIAAQVFVGRRPVCMAGGLLALLSFPMLDALYRVQLVGFVILGAVLGQIALHRRNPLLLLLALLLVTVKPQLSILLVLLWLWTVFRHWSVRSRWQVVAGCAGWVIAVFVPSGPRWPLDWLAESTNWLEPNHPALISSPWTASVYFGLPAWTPVLLAVVLGLIGGLYILRGHGWHSLTAGWAVALSMLLLPYQHSFDSLALLALVLPPAAAMSVPLACALYLLSYSQSLHIFGLPHWLGAALPVGTALVFTALLWRNWRAGGTIRGARQPSTEPGTGAQPDASDRVERP